MIDLHAHLLPGLDDGPSDLEATFEMARAAVAAGTTTMAATPHIDHTMGVDPHRVRPAVESLRGALAEANIPLEVVAGGEVALTRLSELSDEELEAVRLGEGRWILLECPLDPTGGPLEEATFSLQVRGFDVLLAHPERSPQFMRQPDRLRGLVDQGARTSVTASALGGRFGRAAQSVALRFLQEGLVHSLASDAHDHQRRPPEIARGLARAEEKLPGASRLAAWLTEEVPGAIVAGDPLPPPPEVELRRGLLQRLGLRRA